MRKLIVSASALAMLAAFPMGGVQIAQAAIVAGSETCGELPNVKWSWVIGPATIISQTGGEEFTDITDVTYNKPSGPGQVGTGDVTTGVTEQVTTYGVVCTAINPAGKVNDDHSTTATYTETIPGTSTTEENVVVCNPSGTPIGGACPI